MADEKNKTEKKQDGQFSIQKIYIKDISFETTNTPDAFKMDWKPVVDMHITNEATPLGEDLFEVVLSVTLTVKIDDKTIYLVEINQAGIFLIKSIPEDLIGRMLATSCANILFPFAREAVSDIVVRGGFPQLLLSPVNFDALYEQQRKQASEQAKESTTH
tara:strand:+ start:1578 stop:2057 length:480 start_codon:yes stop_codon:yes gene_type:complete